MLIPRHHVFRDFLPQDEHSILLDFVLSNQEKFEEAEVYEQGGAQIVKQTHRSARKLRSGLGHLKNMFLAHVESQLPALFGETGVPAKPVLRLETEVIAHNDGGRFGRHIDTVTGASRDDADTRSVRAVSGVYYFYRQPKAFQGGQLRLFSFGDDGHIDIEPQENALLVFPSFAPHEVLPVTCRSGTFHDSRFSVNCWLHCAAG